MKYIWLQLCVYRETWTGGAYILYRVKSPCKGQVLGYHALECNDGSVILIYLYSVCGIGNHDLVFALLVDHQH